MSSDMFGLELSLLTAETHNTRKGLRKRGKSADTVIKLEPFFTLRMIPNGQNPGRDGSVQRVWR